MNERQFNKGKHMKAPSTSETSATDLVPVILAIAAALLLMLSQASAANTHSTPVSGQGLQVAVSDGGKIMISRDGLTWKTRFTGESKMRRVAFGDGQFVAVGESGAIFTSRNGRHWTQRNAGTETLLCDVAFGNDLFVAVGPGRALLTSADGIKWTRHSTDSYLRSVSFDGCRFVAASNTGAVTLDRIDVKVFAAR